MEHNSERKSVLLIYTGGTIGMVSDKNNNGLKPFDFEHIINEIPELNRFGIKIDSHSFDPLFDSSAVTPDHWVQIAKVIDLQYDHYDGFVILHGTDTMAYTASALSFMFENLAKPIILTGSQLPIGMIRTDGKENVITAIEIAAAQKNAKARVPEVCIYFENQLFRGNRTTKINAEDFEAFRSMNYPALANAGVHIHYNDSLIWYNQNNELMLNTQLDSNLALIKIFPGMPVRMLKNMLDVEGLKALILETYGNGNAPIDGHFLTIIKELIQKDIIVVNVTQCQGGSVDMERYETGKRLAEIGVIGGRDITTEAAITKMMYLLGSQYSNNRIKRYFSVSLRGEITTEK